MKDIKNRIIVTLLALLVLFSAGVGGYMLIEGWNALDALYMTVITLATIGYGETHPLSDAGRVFTILLILGGIGTMTYIFSSITALLIEGELKDIFRRLKMEYKIDTMKDHYLVCGATHTGLSIAQELAATKRPFILIVLEEAEVRKFMEMGYCTIAGDASTDATLLKCGVKNAKGIFCTLKQDKDNAFIAITARVLKPDIRIITVQNENDTAMREKLLRSGADIVISPFHIGGLRMASEMVRPSTAQFLDQMMRDGRNFRFEDVPAGAGAAGRKLSEFNGGEGDCPLVVAVKNACGSSYDINPSGSRQVKEDDIFVVIGSPDELIKFRARVA
ncbi:MAG: NAD-binding protein [Elusimicrobiota bacterium]